MTSGGPGVTLVTPHMADKKYDNTNRGALFRNAEKQNPKQPDYTGTLDIQGTNYRLAGWIQETKSGEKYLSMELSALNPPSERGAQPQRRKVTETTAAAGKGAAAAPKAGPQREPGPFEDVPKGAQSDELPDFD
jgi:hypothetical protein